MNKEKSVYSKERTCLYRRLLVMFLAVAALTGSLVSLTACHDSAVKDADVNEVFEKLKATGYLTTMIPVPERDIFEIYGIDTNKIKQSAFYMSENYAMNADEVAIFEVSDSSYAETLESILNARLTSKANVAKTYSPEEYGKITKASVIRYGNYVYFVVCDKYDELMKIMKENIG